MSHYVASQRMQGHLEDLFMFFFSNNKNGFNGYQVRKSINRVRVG